MAMADRFLREVSDMHQLRKDIRLLPGAKTEEFMKRLGDDAGDDWVFRARDAQLPPPDLSWRRQIVLNVGGGAYCGVRWHKAHSLHRPNHDRFSRCQRRR
jgi:hypothetical protein